VLLHRLRPRLRQLAAPLILVGGLFGVLATPLSLWFGLVPLLYIVTCSLWATMGALRARDPWLLGMAPAVVTVHLSWGAGFLSRLLTSPGKTEHRTRLVSGAAAPSTAVS
jgi:hypothetical protein